MSDQTLFVPGFIGNSAAVQVLGHAIAEPVAAYALVGMPHIGKRTLAQAFVRALLGLTPMEEWRSHPDICLLEAEEGKKQISVEQVRDLRERMSLRPMRAPRVVAYVPAADRLNESGTNALLKVVEEPPAGAVFVLVAEDAGRLPATLKSRCVVLPLDPVPKADIIEALVKRGFTRTQADKMASSSRGRPGLAIEPRSEEGMARGFVGEMLSRSLGQRLQTIEVLSKTCDGSDVPQDAWRAALLSMMEELRNSYDSGPKAVILGTGIAQAMRAVGSSVSPRIVLEATVIKLDGDVGQTARELLPQHVGRGMPGLYLS